MELPDFDTLKRLAATEPHLLETLLYEQIEAVIETANPDQQRRLRGLQFQVDCQRRLAKNPIDSCLRIVNMMQDSFFLMRSEMSRLCYFSEEDELPPLPPRDNVVSLQDHRHK
ncbi:DUF3135 domain-containing protein [Aeromonas molluscorum]|jgi:hypothetical protein|uniref:DUF3135 domain-containing protein n=1 Tax=Aeromonas molluscorum 848 TaxID=1268236 RepID=R1H7B8_9GAMM|nr:DUF3135 domain-containing protein [Aeromonas molluscorum]EOD56381.1 hypothetical protein G113_03966 [Aeromonas molluscorum 848]